MKNCQHWMSESWNAKESLATWPVYQLSNALADTLLDLLEVVLDWALEYRRFLVLRDFNDHWCSLLTSHGSSVIYGSIETLPICIISHISSRLLSRSYFWAGHKCGAGSHWGVAMVRHFALKAQLRTPTISCLGSKLIYASLWRFMDPVGFIMLCFIK